jgi:hypothetical protein
VGEAAEDDVDLLAPFFGGHVLELAEDGEALCVVEKERND